MPPILLSLCCRSVSVHRIFSRRIFPGAQQPYKRNEVREGKHKRTVGFRRVVRENTNNAVESLNQTHDQRKRSNRLARAKPHATQRGKEQRDATRGCITCKAVATKWPE